jgi:hypothetical protein
VGKCIDVELYRKQITLHLPIPESVKDNDKITSEAAPDNSSKSDNENKDIPDNLSEPIHLIAHTADY